MNVAPLWRSADQHGPRGGGCRRRVSFTQAPRRRLRGERGAERGLALCSALPVPGNTFQFIGRSDATRAGAIPSPRLSPLRLSERYGGPSRGSELYRESHREIRGGAGTGTPSSPQNSLRERQRKESELSCSLLLWQGSWGRRSASDPRAQDRGRQEAARREPAQKIKKLEFQIREFCQQVRLEERTAALRAQDSWTEALGRRTTRHSASAEASFLFSRPPGRPQPKPL